MTNTQASVTFDLLNRKVFSDANPTESRPQASIWGNDMDTALVAMRVCKLGEGSWSLSQKTPSLWKQPCKQGRQTTCCCEKPLQKPPWMSDRQTPNAGRGKERRSKARAPHNTTQHTPVQTRTECGCCLVFGIQPNCAETNSLNDRRRPGFRASCTSMQAVQTQVLACFVWQKRLCESGAVPCSLALGATECTQ